MDWGPNGVILPELGTLFPDIKAIRRPGVINAWRWPEFREAVNNKGRKKLIIAGIGDSTCLQFPSLDAVLEGFDVHAVIDVSGAVSVFEREATIATLTHAGVKVRNWWSVGAELQSDWRRDEARGWPYARYSESICLAGATFLILQLRMVPERWPHQNKYSQSKGRAAISLFIIFLKSYV